MLCASVFVVVLDGTIINVALPTLATELGASTSELQWIVDSYVLVFAGLLMAAGSLGDRFGRKGVMQIGLALFAVFSRSPRWSDSPGELIGWRAAMGIGAALMFPATLAILVNVFTAPEGAGDGDRRVGRHGRRRRRPRPGDRRLPARALLVGLGADDQRAGHRRRPRRHRPRRADVAGHDDQALRPGRHAWPRSPASARSCGP